ncbi:hypothetical protein [Chryseobacterium gambrini]|uniref:hypothetical protein n=1 Tax=Chryseobacterium gambrini TaxID=373672 RepID=UPI003BA3EF93
MIESITEHQKLFYQVVKNSLVRNEFRWDVFFNEWFRLNGKPYYFLFKKNLGVTNTQFVELFSLAYNNSSIEYNRKKQPHLLFHPTNHIRETFQSTINSLLENYDGKNDKVIIDFCNRYLDIYTNTVAVDLFHGSCALFLPPGIDINLQEVVFQSGYIHSAGYGIFIRNINKSRKPDFFNAIDQHIKNREFKQEIPFIVYSHEDFSKYDEGAKELIHKGIEHNKIYLDKMSMGRFRLSKILSEIETYFKSRIKVSEPGSYKKKHNFNSKSTIWLISDKSISSQNLQNPGQSRYYICYEQLYKNESPFYLFDENKPGWKSHTTLPHSLTSALINIAKPFDTNGVVCDPFGGTGTTWLETKRMGIKNQIISSDLSPITKLLHKDNLEFFLKDKKFLEEIKLKIVKLLTSNFIECIENNSTKQLEIEFGKDKPLESSFQSAFNLLVKLREKQTVENYEYDFDNEILNSLQELDYFERLIFYLFLKTELRFMEGIKRNSIKFQNAFSSTVKTFLNQLELLIGTFKKDLEIEKEYDNFILLNGRYSQITFPKFLLSKTSDFKNDLENEVFDNKDATILKPRTNSLIICDPPYGFNTTEEDNGLAELYSNFLDSAISSLRPNGQLILCLPAESYTGRDLPFCTQRDIVSRQILLKAKNIGRLAYIPAISLPNRDFFAPYYWESDKALRRSILHFYFD